MKYQKHAARVSPASDSRGFFDAPSFRSLSQPKALGRENPFKGEGASTKQKLQFRIASLFPPSARGRSYRPCAAFDNHQGWQKLAFQIEFFPDSEIAERFTRNIEGKSLSVHSEHVKSEQVRESGFRCNTRTKATGVAFRC